MRIEKHRTPSATHRVRCARAASASDDVGPLTSIVAPAMSILRTPSGAGALGLKVTGAAPSGESEHMFDYCGADGAGRSGDDPPRRPRRLLRVGRATARPDAARPADRRGRRGGAGGLLRGAGMRRARRDGRVAGPPAVPGTAVRRRPLPRVPAPRRPRSWTSSGTSPAGRAGLDRRGVPRRGRGRSTCSVRRATSPARSAGGSATRSACRSRSAWPAPSTWPRSPRRWPSPTGWSSSSPAPSGTSRPAPGRADVGCRSGDAGAAGGAGIRTIGELARRAGQLARAPARRGRSGHKLAALAANVDPRRIETRRTGPSRSARKRRSGGERPRRELLRVDARLPRRPGGRQAAGRRDGPAAPSRCGCGSPGMRSVTRSVTVAGRRLGHAAP